MNARIAPFLELGPMYNAINFSGTYSDPPNTTVSNTPVKFLFCPSDPGGPIDDATYGNTLTATSSYGQFVGDWYVWSNGGPNNGSAFGPEHVAPARRVHRRPEQYDVRLGRLHRPPSGAELLHEPAEPAGDEPHRCSRPERLDRDVEDPGQPPARTRASSARSSATRAGPTAASTTRA